MKITNVRCLIGGVVSTLVVLAWDPCVGQTEPKGGYLTFDGGLALQRDVTIKDSGGVNASFNPGFRLDATVGFATREPNSWGFEFDLGLIYNAMKPITAFNSEGLDDYQIPLLLNVEYTLPLRGPISAYVGVGLGVVYGIYAGDGTSIIGVSGDFVFGYQGTAGLKYSISDQWDLGIAYKILGTSDHDMGVFKTDGTLTHCFLIQLTHDF